MILFAISCNGSTLKHRAASYRHALHYAKRHFRMDGGQYRGQQIDGERRQYHTTDEHRWPPIMIEALSSSLNKEEAKGETPSPKTTIKDPHAGCVKIKMGPRKMGRPTYRDLVHVAKRRKINTDALIEEIMAHPDLCAKYHGKKLHPYTKSHMLNENTTPLEWRSVLIGML